MTYLAALGVPLDVLNYVQGPVFSYVKVMLYAAEAHRMKAVRSKWLEMSPGEQYRRTHGYRP